MQITTETFGEIVVAHAPDDLTEDTVSLLQQAIRDIVAAGRKSVVLQMDQTDAFDSVGLTALVDLQDELKRSGAALKICGLGDSGQKIFEMTRLTRRFDLFDSVIDAVSTFRI